ncbi:MAG: Fe2+-dependent dioxygenase [Mesorhizobium sp.]|uniref:Fe2+-dependent dioxygenase n=1 Tax=Mesorhizobium sp. TaxID=1871066 RepID=UPI000FE9E9C3|nr:Fe2+-dependent dioxygenase [Mesorhizobium sp.]RWM05018.1 MAG: Fe2+-dependent dioxygenase [Mesorhizobium sp.]TIO51262.1 MAG: Fe2+-dependent dioxygenase [Mesorhizobium sp.]TIO55887.1 MAG: Fe2+-dependent dioxygenase [Mesorhizobium sp.]TJV65814.1 MAG: Fe2+-dependent dioxygenase [Mesorhizobium sp.]
MFKLSKVIDERSLGVVTRTLDSCDWQDGRLTAGWQARQVKRNEQISSDDPQLQSLRKIVTEALLQHPAFVMAARPKALVPPRFSRYTAGMTYGDHIDDPVILGYRTDLSLTLFLSDPDAYEGGELVIETASGTEAVKLPAGDAVLYPSTAIHRVDPVRSGMRLASTTWVRSLIRDTAEREILLDLDMARQALIQQNGSSRELDLISKSVANLIRRWADD